MPSGHTSHTIRRSIAGSLVAALLTLAAANAQSGPRGDAARGERLFTAYHCYACHGHTGETGSGPRLNPPRFDQAGFIAYVRSPGTSYRNGGNVQGVMPPYGDVTEQALADVYAYLAALPSGSPELEDIDLIDLE